MPFEADPEALKLRWEDFELSSTRSERFAVKDERVD